MKIKIVFIALLTINFLYNISNASEKIPLNDEQKNLINDYFICQEYTKCELDALKALVSSMNNKTESYDDVVYYFVDRLILVGEEEDWKKYKKFIENFITKSDELDDTQIFISSMWGWRLYTIKSIRDYDKALFFLKKSVLQMLDFRI